MKKFNLPKWKKKQKLGFRSYFTIFVVIIVCVSVLIASVFEELTSDWTYNNLKIPGFVIVVVLSLIIGSLLSWLIGKVALVPIKNIRDSMIRVANGDLNATVKEENVFDEIEDINHAFNIMLRELRSTEIIQSDFVSNVSHEFKTPLTAVEGYATLLQDETLTDAERAEYVNKILLNTHRMSELINNILLLSKLDNHAIKDQREEFNVDEQIRECILILEPKWFEKNIELDIDLESVQYNGNKGLFVHVWSNLLDNAIKFSPINGIIKIELKNQNGIICFSVMDQGEGVKEEDKKHIFNKFYQSDTSHKQQGNGLGLSLVKKIVDIYEGEIELENLTPNGCRFTVKLPCEN